MALIGEEALLIEAGKELLKRGHLISIVASNSDEVLVWASPITTVCKPDLHDQNNPLFSSSYELLLSIANYQIVPPELIVRAKTAAINFHDGPLPDYSGLNVTTWSILNNESEHGVTWHLMDAKADVGSVLHEVRFPIEKDETAWSLNLKCFEAGLRSFSELMDRLESGQTQPRPQDLAARKIFHSWDKPFAGGLIDCDRSADEIVRLVRALDFGHRMNPLCVPKVMGDHDWVSVGKAAACTGSSNTCAGTIVSAANESLRISTSTNDVLLSELCSRSGQELGAEEALSALSLCIGDSVRAAPDKSTLESLWKTTSRFESRVAHTLATLEPITVPDVGAQNKDLLKSQSLDFQRSHYFTDSKFGEDRQSVLATAWISFICRLTGKYDFDVAYSSTRLMREASDESS